MSSAVEGLFIAGAVVFVLYVFVVWLVEDWKTYYSKRMHKWIKYKAECETEEAEEFCQEEIDYCANKWAKWDRASYGLMFWKWFQND
jgi:hypothetical protein